MRRLARSRSARVATATVAAGLVVGLVASSTDSAAAATSTTYSTAASGRFLSGTIAGLNLDTVAGIEGESAANKYGPTVTNKNSLKAELLNKAIEIPLQNGLQLPGLGILQLGAVNQYASASPNGAGLGATGAVDNSGGIGAGGSNGVPTGGATLDLAGLGSAQLSQLINVAATIGAVSSRAVQAPAKADAKSTGCPTGTVRTISDLEQDGRYCIASLGLTLSLPILKQILGQVEAAVDPVLTTVSQGVNQVIGAIPGSSVSIPTLSALLAPLSKISLAGGVNVDLNAGTISIDVEKILQAAGLDLNNLPVDTSLVPYIIKALSGLPAALSNVVGQISTILNNLLSQVKVTLGGTDVGGLVTSLVQTVLTVGASGLSSVLTPLTSGLNTITQQSSAITDLLAKLLDIIVNHKTTADGVLSETAVQLKIGSGLGLNSSIAPIITALGSLLNGKLPTAAATSLASNSSTSTTAVRNAAVKATAQAKKAAASSTSTGKKTTTTVAPTTKVRALAVSGNAASPAAASDVQDVLVSLNLATSTVGPASPRTVSTSSTPTPGTSSAVPSTAVPTGVPAGAGSTGGSPTLPLVLVLLSLGLAAGGVGFYRFRGTRGTH